MSGGTTGGRHAPTSSDRWEIWWSYTRELYLGRHVGAIRATTQLGGTQPRLAADASHVHPDDVRHDLLPLLADALRDRSAEVADSAAIALGRAVDERESAPVVPSLTRNLAHPARSPQQAAAIALGIVGGADATQHLAAIALDNAEGRKLCGATGSIDEMLRGLAVLSLGMIGTRESMAPLVTLATTSTTSRELAAAAVLGLGLQNEAAPAAATTLASLLDERTLDREVRAQVPIAVARLPATASRSLLPRLVAALSDKRTSNELARSLAIAIGHVATPDDGDVVRALTDVARRHDDQATRQFAMLAIGRVFERNVVEDKDAARTRDAALDFLVEQVRKPEQRAARPWAALAVGLFGRGDPTFGTSTPSSALALAARRLVEAFDGESDPSVQGAFAIGLGLLRAPGSAPLLRTRLEETSHPGLRGHLATALGLLNDGASIEPLRKLLADPSLPPSTRIDVARGLALAGDKEFESRLIALFSGASDVPSAIAYAKALGLVGGAASAGSLRKMVENESLPELQRSFAVVALGLLSERTPLPWNVRYLVDANYTVPLRPLEEVLDLL
jgi:HEAT repeat protein